MLPMTVMSASGAAVLQAAQETGAADAAGQNHNAHGQAQSVQGGPGDPVSGGASTVGRSAAAPPERRGLAGVHRHLGQAREVDVQADRGLERVVDDLVHVAGGEHALRAGRERARARAPVRSVSSPSRTVSTPEERAVVVQAAALARAPSCSSHTS